MGKPVDNVRKLIQTIESQEHTCFCRFNKQNAKFDGAQCPQTHIEQGYFHHWDWRQGKMNDYAYGFMYGFVFLTN